MNLAAERKRRGAWYTPQGLVDTVVDAVVTPSFIASRGGHLRIVDPACGDGRFLRAAVARVVAHGGTAHVVGVDVDGVAVNGTRRTLADTPVGVTSDVIEADSLTMDWAALGPASFDLVVGNPPFLSQMAAATTRGGASDRGGGPYADAAVEFLALGAELVDSDGGRVAFVLPQSLLAARDAGAIRALYDERAELVWSRWTGDRDFDAQVVTCVLAFEFGGARRDREGGGWARVVTSRRGVPDVPLVVGEQGAGRVGDRARLNANFRDEYYGMVGAVGDHTSGPPLITSGLIDPGRTRWGERPVTFAKRRFLRPRLDLSQLDDRMARWAEQRLVPKVLVANQTTIIEAVADPDGAWLPGVPVVAAYPVAAEGVPTAWEIAAVLTSPVASAWAWHRSAGTGLSADAIRVGPTLLADLPWPGGDLAGAVRALRAGDVRRCALGVDAAYGISEPDDDELSGWWLAALDRIEARGR